MSKQLLLINDLAGYGKAALRYGGEIPGQEKGTAVFACPDVDTLNVFRMEREE